MHCLTVLQDVAAHRFLHDLNRAIGAPESTRAQTEPLPIRFGLCVSGGPDSVALLLLANAAGIDCEVATVDHQLRPESAGEAAFVAKLCADLRLKHHILTLNDAPDGNVSAWARAQRYDALSTWAKTRQLSYLLTAHHADDQLETMIMRLNRGSGIAGLSGVRRARGEVVRPLLGWRKSELEGIVTAHGIMAIDDPSNRDNRYDRARLRKALAQADWLDPVAAVRSAAALAEAEEALVWTAAQCEAERVTRTRDAVQFDPQGLPREFLRRIATACLRSIDPVVEPRGEALDGLISALLSGRTATLGQVKCTAGPVWIFAKAPARRKN
jgi:tRNA(Ile)-lysidine synthase